MSNEFERYIVRRPGVIIGREDPDVEHLVDEAVDRFEKLTTRDDEFTSRFGKWKRPEHLPKFPIEKWANELITWSRIDPGILEAASFVRSFPERTDQVLVGEIARFCAEAVFDKYATDTTLRVFRFDLLRRLDEVGF